MFKKVVRSGACNLLLAVSLFACGEPSSNTPTPTSTTLNNTPATSTPRPATSALMTVTTAAVSTTLSGVAITIGTSSASASSEVEAKIAPALFGMKQISVENELRTLIARQANILGVKDLSNYLFVSEDPPEKVSIIVGAAVSNDGYQVVAPAANQNGVIVIVFTQSAHPDLIARIGSPAQSLNTEGLSAAAVKYYADQFASHKSVVSLTLGTNLLKVSLAPSTPSVTSGTTILAASPSPTK